MDNPKQIQAAALRPPRRKLQSPSIHNMSSPTAAADLAATAISLKVRLKASDMPAAMQQHALRCTRTLVDSAPTSNNLSYITRSIKQEFDATYGPAWHCIAGTSFGSFVTHSPGGFINFSIDSVSFLLFKTEVRPVMESDGSRVARDEEWG